MKEVNQSILSEIYQERPPESRKYDFGLVLVIGGSDFYSGSPALSALAAFRAGADMIRIIAPKRAADIIASFSPILATYPLEGKYLKKEHLSVIIAMTEAAKMVARNNVAVVLGGGIGRSEETQKTILEYLANISVPVIIDADAIYALKENYAVLQGKEVIITPHYGEFFRLTGREIYDLPLAEKIKIVQEEATKLKAVILLKGQTDIISNGQEVILNKIGSPYLTVGGCGDTLAGIVGALLARGVSTMKSASTAAYLNSQAGLLAAAKFGDSLVATDLIDCIHQVIKK